MSVNGRVGWTESMSRFQKKTANKAKGVLVASGLALVAAGIAGIWLFSENDFGQKRLIAEPPSVPQKRPPVKPPVPRPPVKVKPPARSPAPVGMFDHLSGLDRQLAEAVQAALDDNDWDRTLKAATEALASTNAEVRLNAVDALGWFGAPALPELTGAMGDPDENVRQAAGNHFESALGEVEKSADRFGIAMAAFGALGAKDQLESLEGIVTGAANDFIDDEEDEQKVAENRVEVVKALAKLIEGGNKANAEAAQEAFKDITGNEWHGVDEAEKYLVDPENYEEPEVE